jgi:large subunit ribosomal protein L18
MATQEKVRARRSRHRRVRKRVAGTAERPRLAVYRSNRHIYAQLVDDLAGRTMASASTVAGANGKGPKEDAKAVGGAIAAKAKDAGITRVVFDRGGFMYHGRIEAVADGAREGGLEF